MEPASHLGVMGHAVRGVDADGFHLVTGFEVGHHNWSALLGEDEGVLWEACNCVYILVIIAWRRAKLILLIKLSSYEGNAEENQEDDC
jgi:hypothetical protein